MAQNGCQLFTTSIDIDASQSFGGNGLATLMGRLTAYSRTGTKMARVRITLVDAEQQRHCKDCDTTWSPTPGLVVSGTLSPSLNRDGSSNGTVQNTQHQFISWGSTDSVLRNPLLQEDPFLFELALQFNSPEDSLTSTISARLNFEFTDVSGRQCDTTVTFFVNTIHTQTPFNSTYTERIKSGVLVRESWGTERNRPLAKLKPDAESDNTFRLDFAWKRTDVSIDGIVFNTRNVVEPSHRITRVSTSTNNVPTDYLPDTEGRITVPVSDQMVGGWDPDVTSADFGTFTAKIYCEGWTASAPNSLDASLSYRYTPIRGPKKPRNTIFEDYSCIRPTKVGNSGLSENTTDPKPGVIKAYMLSFVNDNPTKRSVYFIDIRPMDSSVKIIGVGNIRDDASDGGITAWIDNSYNCESCIRAGNPSQYPNFTPMVDNTYGATTLGGRDPALFWIDACCREKVYQYSGPKVNWWDFTPSIDLQQAEEGSDGPGHFDPTIRHTDVALNPNINVRNLDAIEYEEKPRPMILFISNAGETTPLTFAARDRKGKIVSRGTVVLKNVVSSIDVNGGMAGLAGGIYPSPADEGATLNFDNSNELAPVSISLIDLKGGIVKSILKEATLSVGPQAIYFETLSIPSGAYTLRVVSGRSVGSFRLTVTH